MYLDNVRLKSPKETELEDGGRDDKKKYEC